MAGGESALRGSEGPGLALVLAALLLSGCAFTNDTLALSSPAGSVVTREHGAALRIERVTDARSLEDRPDARTRRRAGSPAEAVGAIAARRIGRKRNAFGRPGGWLLLPEDERVEDLVAQRLRNALRACGLRVLEPEEPGWPEAIPIVAVIERFEADLEPGLGWIQLVFEARLRVEGPAASWPGLVAAGRARRARLVATRRAFRETIEQGLDRLSADLRVRICDPAAAGWNSERIRDPAAGWEAERIRDPAADPDAERIRDAAAGQTSE
ncbi:MAG: hypothetical protein R3F16_16350 [Myxococcota bacterium]